MGYCLDLAIKNAVDKEGRPLFTKKELIDINNNLIKILEKHINNPAMAKKAAERFATIQVVTKRKQIQEKIDNSHKQLYVENVVENFKDKSPDPAYEAATAMIETSNLAVAGSQMSVSGLFKNFYTYLRESLTLDIEMKGLKPYTHEKFDVYTARAVFDLETTGKINPIKGVDKNTMKAISQLAEVYSSFNKKAVQTLRSSGIYIGEIPGYIGRQIHDSEKIVAAGFDVWHENIKNKLDYEKTFHEYSGDPKAQIGILQSMYEHIVTGEGTFGMGRYSKGRQLHFKSPELWLEYAKDFGNGATIFENYSHSIKGIARFSSIVSMFGTNYKEVLGNLKSKIKNPNNKLNFENMTAMMWGVDERAGTSKKAIVGKVVRSAENASKLLYTVFAALNDNVTMALALQHKSGESIMTAWMRNMFGMVETMGTSREKQRAYLGGIGVDSEFSNTMMLSRILGDENMATGKDFLSGAATRMNNWTYTWNFTRHWTAAAKHTLARNLVNDLEKTIRASKITEVDFKTFAYYGINPTDISNLQKLLKSKKIKSLNIDEIMKADTSLQTPDGTLSLNYRGSLAFKVANMVNQIVEKGVPTPGKKEARQTLRYTDPDTWTGQIARTLSQFKLTPLKQHNSMAFLARASGKHPAYYVGCAAALGFASYYVSDTIKKYLKGDDSWQRAPWEMSFLEVGDYMIRGGGLGLVADTLGSSWQNGMWIKGKSTLGPAAGTFLDAGDIAAKMISGKSADKATANFIINNLPFAKHPALFSIGFTQGMRDTFINIFDF